MNMQQWALVQEIFDKVCDMEPTRREEVLDQSCGDDGNLRQEVLSLLEGHDRDGEFLQEPACDELYRVIQKKESEKEAHPEVVGPYQIVDQIGLGGMGAVYKAEQIEPVQRMVALKIMTAGMNREAFLARFQYEHQALAMMSHPNIAHVYDAGTTMEGRPYFTMEYIEGEPITDYCDRKLLSVKERLILFLQVCEGVLHAHRRGLIHRDLKPSNILITETSGAPVPKIIDFGIAKAREQSEEKKMTVAGMLLGTPAYMSPEQADGGEVNTASDVYSLGVLLYELLTGKMPIESNRYREAGPVELIEMIKEAKAPKPSLRLVNIGKAAETVGALRGMTAATLLKSIRGDLDWIIMTAMAKDRKQRYPSVAKLAEEVEHYLNDEPVEARPPSWMYIFKKFVTRHKFGAIAIMALLIGIPSIVISFSKERNKTREMEAQAFRSFMDLFDRLRPGQDIKDSSDLIEALSADIDTMYSDPEKRALLREYIGNIYYSWNEYKKAINQYDLALQERGYRIGNKDVDSLRVVYFKALVSIRDREYTDAGDLFTQLIEILDGTSDPLLYQAYAGIAETFYHLDDYQEAHHYFQISYDGIKKALGAEHLETTKVLANFANNDMARGDILNAIQKHAEALSIRQSILDKEHSLVYSSMTSYGTALRQTGQISLAESYLTSAYEFRMNKYGPDHKLTLIVANNLALTLQDMGCFSQAEEISSDVFQISKKKYGKTNTYTLFYMNNLANLYIAMGQYENAISYKNEELKIRMQFYSDKPDTYYYHITLGEAYLEKGEYHEALAIFQKVMESLREFPNYSEGRKATAEGLLGVTLYQMGEFQEAYTHLQAAVNEIILADLRLQVMDTLDLCKGKLNNPFIETSLKRIQDQ